MRIVIALVVAVLHVPTFAQPIVTEPGEFPANFPGPGGLHPGTPCLLLASGAITPGDVDWVQVTVPRASLQTVIDVDFPPSSASALLAFVVGGNSGFNSSDNNNARDNFCGLGSATTPVGSLSDSAVDLGATPRNAVINIGVTGAGDSGFTGNHSRSFTYEVWVRVVPGPCVANSDCFDGVDCTSDACTVSTGACTNAPDDLACDNDSFCDGDEICDPTEGCLAGDPPDCDDGVDCTIDDCRDADAACVNTPDDSACDDGVHCNGLETCDAAAGCQPGTPPDCDDGLDCTVDACDEQQAACTHTADDAACDNGSDCDGTEWCSPSLGCQAGADPLDCDDGLFCNGAETCDADHGCLPGTDPCAGALCRESDDHCVECLSDADCDDGDPCNGSETCDADGACADGTPPCGPDEACDPGTGECESGDAGLTLDIRPGVCPNPFKPRGHGRMRVALIASGGFDIMTVDLGSLRLSRADGKGGKVAPRERRRGPKFAREDRPFSGGGCECRPTGGPNTRGILLVFEGDDLTDALGLAKFDNGERVELIVSGKLTNGTPFTAADCVTIVGNAKGKKR